MGMRRDWGPVQKEVPGSRRCVYRCGARALGYVAHECHNRCSVREIVWVCLHSFCVIGMHVTVYDCMHALECGMLAYMIDVRATNVTRCGWYRE